MGGIPTDLVRLSGSLNSSAGREGWPDAAAMNFLFEIFHQKVV
jgi:hypothetical protein